MDRRLKYAAAGQRETSPTDRLVEEQMNEKKKGGRGLVQAFDLPPTDSVKWDSAAGDPAGQDTDNFVPV